MTLLLIIVCLAGCRPAAPCIAVDKPEFDLGAVEEGIEVSHTYKIRNTGGVPLHLIKAEASCGCTVPKFKSNVIPPGATGQLDVTMDTSMKQGFVKKKITLTSNDPAHPVTLIYIDATVKNPHAGLTQAGMAKIFTGRCAACHVNEGQGKFGEDLFLADCAMVFVLKEQ